MTNDQNNGLNSQSHIPIQKTYPKFILFLFYLFSAYLVIPVIDVPLLGLSLSAPIFFLIAVNCILKPPRPWFRDYLRWILLAIILWAGIFISAWANGLLSGGINIDTKGISTVIRYAYWLIVFVVTAYFVSQGQVLKKVSVVLGWGVFILALLRWGEVLLYGNIGAWSGTHLLSQNTYGFLFSTFSPFLLLLVLQEHGKKRTLAATGILALWGAVAINGSRGSWIAIASGLGLCLVLLISTRSRKSSGLLILLIFAAGSASVVWSAFPEVANAVSQRLNTFETLDTEKSYLIRELMNQKAWKLFSESPLIGVGASRFTESSTLLDIPRALSYASQTHFDIKSSHNSYLGFLAECGLMGAIPFAVLLISLGVGGLRASLYFVRKGQLLVLVVFISFIQMSIHMWVISSLTNTANWFIYGLAAATLVLYQQRKKEICV